MGTSEFIRKRTFDPVQRVLHWWVGATVTALAGLGWAERFLEAGTLKKSFTNVHIALGFALTVGFVLRILLGAFGPKQARFCTIWRTAFRKKHAANLASVKDGQFGYEAPAAAAYLFLYIAVACAVGTGLLLSGMRYDQGPFASWIFDEIAWHEVVLSAHNISLYAVTLFVLAHLTGMIRHEKKIGVPVAQAMISGYQYRIVERRGKHS